MLTPMNNTTHKCSYSIACASSFRDAVNALATSLQSNVADIARSILLVIPENEIWSVPDPGGPTAQDREQLIIKSGVSAGKLWRRKPRLQVRLRAGYEISIVRRALNMALKLYTGQLVLNLADPAATLSSQSIPTSELLDEIERLRNFVSVLAFNPVNNGISNVDEALYVLGFGPNEKPDKVTIRSRFRKLVSIHHPDSIFGDNHRMSQLNAALELLCR